MDKIILVITGRKVCFLQFCKKYNYNPHSNKVIHISRLRDLLGLNLHNVICEAFITYGYQNINIKELIDIEDYLYTYNIKFEYKDY